MARDRRLKLWILFVLGLAGVSFALRRVADVPSARPAPPDTYPATATVSRVIDGDSFVTAEGHEVRLLSIDTPEYGRPFAQQAKARLKELALGRRVSLSYDQEKKDRYGRLLCHVRIGSVWANRVLVREGLATVFLVKPNLSTRSEFIAAQDSARREKIGIWSLPPPPPEDYYICSPGGFRFHRPACRFARQAPARNKIKVRSRDEALDAGLSPCRECRP